MRWTMIAVFLLAGCAENCTSQTAQLFFGRTPDKEAWTSFLADTVTPRFPDGLTVIEASGQWRQRSTGKIVSEPSTILEIVTDGTAEDARKFEEIRSAYKTRFHQESVGLVTNRSCASW